MKGGSPSRGNGGRLRALSRLLIAIGLAMTPALTEGQDRLALTILDDAKLEFRALDGRVLATVPTGEGPRSITLNDGNLFVTNRGLEDRPGSSLTVVDTESMTVKRTVKVCDGCAPRDSAYDDWGRLWFTGQAHRAVYWTESSYEDPAGSVLVGSGWPVEITPLRGKGLLAVGMRGGSSIAIIDASKTAVKTILVGRYPAILEYEIGRDRLWIASDSGGPLATLSLGDPGSDGAHDLVRDSVVAGDAVLIAGESRLLLSEKRERALVVISTETGEEFSRTEIEGTPGPIALSPDARRAAVFVDEPARIELFNIGADGGLSPSGRFDVESRVSDLHWLP